MTNKQAEKEQTRQELQPAPDAALQLSQPEIEWRLMERQALALSKARGVIPEHYRDKPGDIVAALMMAKSLRLDPFAVMRGTYVVKGKVAMMGDLMLAIARGNGVKVHEEVREHDGDGEPLSGGLTAFCRAELPSGEVIIGTYSERDAETAGLWNSSDPWRKFPSRMLTMRARGWTLRDAIPHLLGGLYSEGELEGDQMKDVTP